MEGIELDFSKLGLTILDWQKADPSVGIPESYIIYKDGNGNTLEIDYETAEFFVFKKDINRILLNSKESDYEEVSITKEEVEVEDKPFSVGDTVITTYNYRSVPQKSVGKIEVLRDDNALIEFDIDGESSFKKVPFIYLERYTLDDIFKDDEFGLLDDNATPEEREIADAFGNAIVKAIDRKKIFKEFIEFANKRNLEFQNLSESEIPMLFNGWLRTNYEDLYVDREFIFEKFYGSYAPVLKKLSVMETLRPKKRTNAYNWVFDRIVNKIAPGLLNQLENAEYVSDIHGKSQYNEDESGLMYLSIEGIEKDDKGRFVISMAHYYEQNRDLMSDPYMTLRLDTESKTGEALSFQMDGVVGNRTQNVYGLTSEGKEGVVISQKRSQNQFLNKWTKNLVDQKHKVEFKALPEKTEESIVLSKTSLGNDIYDYSIEELSKYSGYTAKDMYDIRSYFVVSFDRLKQAKEINSSSDGDKYLSILSEMIESKMKQEGSVNPSTPPISNLEEQKEKYPIVLEWSEGFADEHLGFNNVEELETKLKTIEVPSNGLYNKNKVWFKGVDYGVRIDIGESEGDYNHEKQSLMNWLEDYDNTGNIEFYKFEKSYGETRESEKSEDSKVLSKLKKDARFLVGIALSKQNGNGTQGYDINLFKTSFFGRIKTLKKNGEQNIVNDALNYLSDIQKESLKKPIFTTRHKIWSLRDFVPTEVTITNDSDKITPYPDDTTFEKEISVVYSVVETILRSEYNESLNDYTYYLNSGDTILHSELQKEVENGDVTLTFPKSEVISKEAQDVVRGEWDKMQDFINNKPESKYFKGLDFDYKNQFELNKAIEEFLDSKDVEYVFNDLEKQFIYSYAGYGGLEKQGATGKGLLWEYYTPKLLVEKMWGLAYKYGFNSGKVLEPSVGVGNFINYASVDYDKVTAYEISKYSARICKIVHPKTSIIEKSFAEHFYNGNVYNPKYEKDFDLVIGNPPYGKNVDKRAVAEAKRIGVSIAQFEHYFILRGLDCLKPGGLLVYVSTANLFTKGYEKIKTKISERAELVDGYLLPNKTFKTTEIGTSIIVLRKK